MIFGGGALWPSDEGHGQANIVCLPGLSGPVMQCQLRGVGEDCIWPILLICALLLIVGIVWVEGGVDGTTISDAFFMQWHAIRGGGGGGQ